TVHIMCTVYMNVYSYLSFYCFFFSSRRRHTRSYGDWSSDVCSSDLELISKNRQLQRQVTKLTERTTKSTASKGVERGLRTISRRVQRALGSATKRGRKAAPANGRKRKAATRRRRTS